MIINPNSATGINANNLNVGSLGQVKSSPLGNKTVGNSDQVSNVSVASPGQSQSKRLDDLLTSLSDTISYSQTQDGYLKVVSKAFSRLEELALTAEEYTLSRAERDALDSEFAQIQEKLNDIATKKFNDSPLFSGNSLEVAVDTAGTKVKLDGIDLVSGEVYGPVLSKSVSISTPDSASNALSTIRKAIDQIAEDRTKLAETQGWLADSSDEALNTRESISTPALRTLDAGLVGTESEYARREILFNSNTSVLTQANAQPESVFELLQGALS
jgi:flagellin